MGVAEGVGNRDTAGLNRTADSTTYEKEAVIEAGPWAILLPMASAGFFGKFPAPPRNKNNLLKLDGMTEETEALQRKIDGYYWYHSFDFGNGLVAKGLKDFEHLKAETDLVFNGLDLNGKSVLDIGAWHGHFSFAAKKLGAGRVVAADKYAWELHDGRETFDLAKSLLKLDVEPLLIDVPEISRSTGQFDVVLFLDVFYHLFDPQTCMKNLSACATDLLVVRTHQDHDAICTSTPVMVHYPDGYGGDPSNHWGPNPPLMYGLLRTAGFKKVYYQDHPVSGRTRGTYHAFRNDAAVARLAPARPSAWIDLADKSVWDNEMLPKKGMTGKQDIRDLAAAAARSERMIEPSRNKLAKALVSVTWNKLWR